MTSTMAKPKTTLDDDDAAPTEEAATSPEYTVLARRYRPQQFSDLVGQEAISQVLVNALESHRVAHAYLFTGARGVGKTSTARILAKCLNCAKGPTIHPCDECDMCRAIAVGEDTDVLEIDGASNNGVDQVRELRQNVQFRPSRSRYKIYIIDEVHMLTNQAFNALLKTLEEPPAHVKFIFATTEVQKIPVTILSRCQRFDFSGISLTAIIDRLKKIVAAEHMEADDEALRLIARRANTSMRDAQSLLDQLLSFGSKKLTAEQVHQLLGTANEERIAALAGAVLEKNAARALEIIGQTVDQGLQLGELLDQLMDYWRDLMVVQCTGDENQILSVTGQQGKALKEQAGRLKPDTVLAGLDILATTRTRLRNASQGRVLVEMALVRLSRLDDLVSLSQLAQWAASREAPPAAGSPPSTTPIVRAPMPQPVPTTPVNPVNPAQVETEKKKEPGLTTSPSPQESTGLTQESLAPAWAQVILEAGFALQRDLRKAEVAISGPNALVLRFPTGYNHSIDATKQGRVEEVVRQVMGPNVVVRLDKSPAQAAASVAAEPTVKPAPVAETPTSRNRRSRGEVAQLPLVKKAMDLLGAQIIDLAEDFATSAPETAPPAEERAVPSGEDEALEQ
jgi:DNA polymerase-3 subunit gamma/tau